MLFFYYGAGDLGNTAVRLGRGFRLEEAAEAGTLGISQVLVDDLAGSLDLVGLHAFRVVDTACSWQRLFTGYFAERSLSRADSLLLGAARRWDCSVTDINSALNFEVIRNSAANRPAETDIARITWWLGSGFTGPVGSALTFIDSTNPVNMDASDYRGRTGYDLLTDCGQQSGKNYFAAYDETTDAVLVHYYAPSFAINSSTLKISNVAADVDESTVFCPDSQATLTKDPSSRWSGVYLAYGTGVSAVYETDAGVLADIGHKRETALTDSTVNTSSKATAKADQFLAQSSNEFDKIRVTLRKVPAAQVNLIRAGQRVQVKFTHFPGYTSYTYIRISRRTVEQDGDNQLQYRLTLELSNTKLRPHKGLHDPPATQTDDVPDATLCDDGTAAIGTSDAAQLLVASGIETFTFGAGTQIASKVSPNVAYTVCGCALGCGGWGPGLTEIESWYSIALGNLTANDVGLNVVIGAAGSIVGIADYAAVGVWHGTPTALGEWAGVGSVSLASGGTIFIPRALLDGSLQNYMVLAPGWHASRGAFFCAAELINGCSGPVVGGEGGSGQCTRPTVSSNWQKFCSDGHAPWVSGIGAVDGSNTVFTLIGWTGHGTPKARVGALIMGHWADYTYDASAGTVTFRDPPPQYSQVAFRYMVQV